MSHSSCDDLRDQNTLMNHSPLSVLLMDLGAEDTEIVGVGWGGAEMDQIFISH